MLKRVLVGATLLAVVVGCGWYDLSRPGESGWALAALGAALFVTALWELLVMTQAKRSRRVLGTVAGLAWMALLVAGTLLPSVVWQRVAVLLTWGSVVSGLLMGCQVRAGPGPTSHRLSQSLWFSVPYVAGLACLVALALDGYAGWAVGVALCAKSSDIGAYFAGKSLGRHKLAPLVSPNKTLEGAAGGVVLAALVGAFLLPAVSDLALPGGAWGAAAHGAVVALLAMLSDLTESLIKRSRDVKDSGTWFGESGGALDLADSLLLVGPFALAYTAVLA